MLKSLTETRNEIIRFKNLMQEIDAKELPKKERDMYRQAMNLIVDVVEIEGGKVSNLKTIRRKK